MAVFVGIAWGVTPDTCDGATWRALTTARDVDDVRVMREDIADARADDPVVPRYAAAREGHAMPCVRWGRGHQEYVGALVAADANAPDLRCGALRACVWTAARVVYRDDINRAQAEWNRFRRWCRDHAGFDPGTGALHLVVDCD